MLPLPLRPLCRRCLRVRRSIVRDEHEAEDITHNVFAKLVTAIHRYEPARCRCGLDPARFAQCRARPSARPAPDPVRGGPHDRRGSRAGRLRPLAVAREPFTACLQDQREVLVLRHIAGLSPSEIARRIGKTESSVHGLHHRGREPFRLHCGSSTQLPSSPARRLGDRLPPRSEPPRGQSPGPRPTAGRYGRAAARRDALGERLMLERLPAAGLERHGQRAGPLRRGLAEEARIAGRPRCRGGSARPSPETPRGHSQSLALVIDSLDSEAFQKSGMRRLTTIHVLYRQERRKPYVSARGGRAIARASPRPACGSCDRGAIRPS